MCRYAESGEMIGRQAIVHSAVHKRPFTKGPFTKERKAELALKAKKGNIMTESAKPRNRDYRITEIKELTSSLGASTKARRVDS